MEQGEGELIPLHIEFYVGQALLFERESIHVPTEGEWVRYEGTLYTVAKTTWTYDPIRDTADVCVILAEVPVGLLLGKKRADSK